MESFVIGVVIGALAVAFMFSVLLIVRNIKEYKKLVEELKKQHEEKSNNE